MKIVETHYEDRRGDYVYRLIESADGKVLLKRTSFSSDGTTPMWGHGILTQVWDGTKFEMAMKAVSGQLYRFENLTAALEIIDEHAGVPA